MFGWRELLILAALFFFYSILPAVLVSRSNRTPENIKIIWLVLTFLLSWFGLLGFFMSTQSNKLSKS
jgi:uncharacterized RDD family membrane protein YckC